MIVSLVAALLAAAPQDAPAASLPSRERRQELLFEAARAGRVDLIDPLVKTGADLNGYDKRGFTPLILAAYNGQAAAVDALIQRGADPCKPDAAQGNTAQMGVAFKGDDTLAARLLKEKCDVNARNKAGQTALMMAALFRREKQIELLLAAGADPTLTDAEGRSAATVAAGQGSEAVARRLENGRENR
ncbi:ankyrin repeat domain-containing protein [Sphingomonas sp. IC-56]|uniref:ankyrin repeat domain-containing protein n=1 Tax=Sphingomonas sp. IC-56 TaxID=2898529 RepID=UPI001E58F3CD|nr:ankyrin repeat domain-containing protein [Sphingomonas sp. IC-56]MCD2324075.1 ankyrin repeat domain-containing protein [Sphingomonas sp. IC-56]